jgi:hypothetical protein
MSRPSDRDAWDRLFSILAEMRSLQDKLDETSDPGERDVLRILLERRREEYGRTEQAVKGET